MSIRFLAAALFAASMSAVAAPQTYVLDPTHTQPNFIINHFGMSQLYGRFDDVAGKVVLDQAARAGNLEIRIKTASINTGIQKYEPGSLANRMQGARSRDDHLRTADFFNVAEFPEMIYRSTKLNFNGDNVESVEGNLTLLGVTKPLKLQVTSFRCGPHPFNKKQMCGANVEGSLKRTEFGMKFAVPAVADEVKLVIGLEGYLE